MQSRKQIFLLNESKIQNFKQSCTKQEENHLTHLRIKQEREKTKTSLWNRQGNEEPISPAKHCKTQHGKGNKNHPEQRKTQNNMDHSRIPSPKQTKTYPRK